MKSRLRIAIGALGLVFSILAYGSSNTANAQDPNAKAFDPPLAASGLTFTGYISQQPVTAAMKVIGGDRENLKYSFTHGDLVFLNKGSEEGVKEGTFYSIVRPMGEMKQPFTHKELGYYVRELGVLRVVSVQGATSVAKIVEACDTVWMGDLLVPYEPFTEPQPRVREGAAAGSPDDKVPHGQIILSNGMREYLGQNDVVFLDFGADQGVQPGDMYTIYRAVGATEGPVHYTDDKINRSKESGFGSHRYRGGEFSTDVPAERTDKLLETRPSVPTRNLGELVVLKVEGTTSVARILRSNEEVNIGDWVKPKQ
jgi:hypothetical protein